MRSHLLATALCLLAAGVGVCQAPSGTGTMLPRTGAILGQPQAGSARVKDLNELRARIDQLQSRLAQVTGPADTKAAEKAPALRQQPSTPVGPEKPAARAGRSWPGRASRRR
jgi:hypothetical protein